MNDYKAVSDALAAGADPAMLCGTCPWDRYCITPPSMTRADIDEATAKAKADDDLAADKAKAAGEKPGFGMGSLMTIMMFAGKDTAANMCPVAVNRLRSSQGRALVDGMKTQMQTWDDAL